MTAACPCAASARAGGRPGGRMAACPSCAPAGASRGIRSDAVTGLIALLSDGRFGACVNPYRDDHEVAGLDRPGAAAIRRANLAAYLGERDTGAVLLVGEAMGYRGGR